MATDIKTFSSKGTSLTVRQRSTSLKPTPVAKLVRARLDQGEGIPGGRVVVTNPAYANRRKRTASLGMGGVGQRGRSMDL